MEIQRLNSGASNNQIFQPIGLIENYDSCIWTERYAGFGDFQIVSSDVDAALKLLPLESYIGLRESTVPMIVEAHKIEKPKGKHARVTITGRSFDSVLERRASVNTATYVGTPSQRAAWNVLSDKVSDAAYKAMRGVLGDIARSNLPALSPFQPQDAIPEVNLPLPTDYTTGLVTTFEIKPGNLYTVVRDMLEVNHHGLRAVRPLPGIGKYTVDLEVYNGADLRNTVAFDARFDQFDSSTYLLSYQGSMNVAYVYGNNAMTIKNKTATTYSGLQRRVLLVDEMSDANLNSPENRSSRALVELYKANATALFDGEVSVQLGQRFNKPVAQGGYGLGDIIKLQGEYNMERIVRVAEFIRSSDSSGESAFPAFQVIDE